MFILYQIVSSFFCLLKYLRDYSLSQCDNLLKCATSSVMQVLCEEDLLVGLYEVFRMGIIFH